MGVDRCACLVLDAGWMMSVCNKVVQLVLEAFQCSEGVGGFGLSVVTLVIGLSWLRVGLVVEVGLVFGQCWLSVRIKGLWLVCVGC